MTPLNRSLLVNVLDVLAEGSGKDARIDVDVWIQFLYGN